MNVKTMEGLAGAGTSISMIATPMSAAKEAERKGDTDKMTRALGYAAELTDQAEAYGKKAEQGMKLDAEEAKEKEKLQQENLIQARREERKEQAERAEAKAEEGTKTPKADFDSLQISGEGRESAESAGQGQAASGSETGTDSVSDVIYGSSGEIAGAVEAAGENIDVRV